MKNKSMCASIHNKCDSLLSVYFSQDSSIHNVCFSMLFVYFTEKSSLYATIQYVSMFIYFSRRSSTRAYIHIAVATLFYFITRVEWR